MGRATSSQCIIPRYQMKLNRASGVLEYFYFFSLVTFIALL